MKLAGILMILTASSLGGFAVGHEEEKHCRALLQVQELLQMLMGEIRCSYAPYPEAFRRMAERIISPWDHFLLEMAGELEAYRGQRMAEIWEAQVERLPPDCGLKMEERRELARLGGGLGYLDSEVQLAAIGQFLEGWQERRAAAVRDLRPRQRICRCMGISLGIVLALILA